MGRLRAMLPAWASGALLALAGAGEVQGTTFAKSGYTLFDPTPDAALRDMSTDRPDKTESPYTVDAGRIQVETDLMAYTRDAADGRTLETLDVLPINIKVGLTHRSDIQFVYGGYSAARLDGGGTPSQRDSGFGDLVVRYKYNVWGNDGGRTALAVMPFVTLPVSTLAGAVDDVEGGLIVPLAIELGNGLGLGLMTEIDLRRVESGRGYAPSFINSATVGFELTKKLGAYAEIYTERSSDDGAQTIVTADFGLTYGVTEHMQLDAGINIGLSEAADDLNVFAGLSRRF